MKTITIKLVNGDTLIEEINDKSYNMMMELLSENTFKNITIGNKLINCQNILYIQF